jgi:thymidylate synthase
VIDQQFLDQEIAEVVQQNLLRTGDLSRSVAVCALWKDLSRALDGQPLDSVSLVGNLFTSRGISLMLRTLWLVPRIRTLVVWGPDTTHTGSLLFRLWEEGLQGDHNIAGSDVRLDAALPHEAVDHLRRHVRLVDLRSLRDFGSVARAVQELPELPPHAEPRLFSISAVLQPVTLPSLGVGYHVEAQFLVRAWLKALHLVMQFGTVKPSEHRLSQKEILGLTTVVRRETPGTLRLPSFMPVTAQQVEDYVPLVVEDARPEGMAYTYGHRLRSYFRRDQVEEMHDRLRRAWYTRRANAVLWDSANDPDGDNPPCITQVVANVVERRLFLTYVVRSQEMFEGWPLNTAAMLELQRRLAEKQGMEAGPLASFTVSAHLYEDRWPEAERILAEHYRPAVQAFDADPRGNFLIRFEEGRYVAELLSPAGDQVIWHGENEEAYQLGQEIVHLGLASLPEHLLYLGWQLREAAQHAAEGRAYIQGRA